MLFSKLTSIGAVTAPSSDAVTGATVGVGVLYDMLDSSGENFKNEQFGVQMITTVTDANPTSAYLFVKSRQTMLFNEQGIQIIQ